jgi:chemotaxis protein histidine kinase CheA
LRIEKFRLENIQQVGQQEYLPYHGKGLPLVRLNTLFPVSPLPPDLEEGYLIIPNTAGYEFGIIASRILDTVQVEAELQPVFDGQQPGLAGAAVIQGRMTMFIEPEPLAQRTRLCPEPLPNLLEPMPAGLLPETDPARCPEAIPAPEPPPVSEPCIQ